MKTNKLRQILSVSLAVTLSAFAFAGCGDSSSSAADTSAADTASASSDSNGDVTVLKALADLTPHSELLEFIAPQLEEQGIEIDIVSTGADATWYEKVDTGEVDFAFFAHWPAVENANETNGFHLVNAGDIHVEPIAAYSDKWGSVDEVPDDATVVIPNDATNEYRALKILEDAGFITLDPEIESELKASLSDITEYIKPITIVEMDAVQIISHTDEFDIYITNTNHALEAGLDTTKYLFREGEDSPYANIIAVAEGRDTDPAIEAVVAALKSDETKQYILDTYNGAVIPAE